MFSRKNNLTSFHPLIIFKNCKYSIFTSDSNVEDQIELLVKWLSRFCVERALHDSVNIDGMHVTAVELHLDVCWSPFQRVSIVRISDVFRLILRSAAVVSVIVAAGDGAVMDCALDIMTILVSSFPNVDLAARRPATVNAELRHHPNCGPDSATSRSLCSDLDFAVFSVELRVHFSGSVIPVLVLFFERSKDKVAVFYPDISGAISVVLKVFKLFL